MIALHRDTFQFEHKTSYGPIKEHYINHMHLEWQLLYLVDGRTSFFLNNATYQLQEGDLILIHPLFFHFATPEEDLVYERIVINFPEEIIPPVLLAQLKNLPSFFRLPDDSPIKTLLLYSSDIVKNYSSDDAYFAITNILNTILLNLKYHQKNSEYSLEPIVTNILLKNILDYIDNNLVACSNLENITKHFYISTSWLAHTFKKYLNITPKQYINYKKILYSQKLISTGTHPSIACLKVGFNDYSTFYRLYKKFLKTSPQEEYKNRGNNTLPPSKSKAD
ncbi:MAG: AraC family transcriptional regulator [Clostridia bacterium]|nr:AraC family transcriptional regulator [Clostridia bacterium]